MKEREKITAYVTRYAFTSGILTVEAEVCDGKKMIYCSSINVYVHGDDWHRTKERAIAQAEKMRVKKIASLKKQIAKIEALIFV